MKISCTPISMAKMFQENKINLEGYINLLGEIQIEGVDLMDSLCYPWQYGDKDKEIREVNKWIEKNGLKLSAIACGNNFAKFKKEEREENVKKVKNAIHEAAELGAPLVRIFGGYHEDCGGEPGMIYANGFEFVLQGLEACLPEAEKYDVVLAIENHGRLPGLSYEIKALINHFNSPYFKCMFDCANFLANNMNETEDPLKAYELLKDDIVHCHVKDWGKPFGAMAERRVAAYPAGAGGIVPLRQFFALLERDGFEGYCSLEYEASWQVPEKEGVEQSLNYLKEIRGIHNVL
jgi:sugar phosphate isomerase/epimerase